MITAEDLRRPPYRDRCCGGLLVRRGEGDCGAEPVWVVYLGDTRWHGFGRPWLRACDGHRQAARALIEEAHPGMAISVEPIRKPVIG